MLSAGTASKVTNIVTASHVVRAVVSFYGKLPQGSADGIVLPLLVRLCPVLFDLVATINFENPGNGIIRQKTNKMFLSLFGSSPAVSSFILSAVLSGPGSIVRHCRMIVMLLAHSCAFSLLLSGRGCRCDSSAATTDINGWVDSPTNFCIPGVVRPHSD